MISLNDGTLTLPSPSLRERGEVEGAHKFSSPLCGEAAVRAEPLASSGEARAERIRGD
jgi:hypothetical protein